MKNILFLVFVLSFLTHNLSAQHTPKTIQLKWKTTIDAKKQTQQMGFEGAVFSGAYGNLPTYLLSKEVTQNNLEAQLSNFKTQTIAPNDAANLPNKSAIETDFVVNQSTGAARDKMLFELNILPFRLNPVSQTYERLLAFDVVLTENTTQQRTIRTQHTAQWAANSVLAKGVWHKIAIDKDGIYKIDAAFLKNELKLNPDAINPQQLRVFGNGGGMLPEANAKFRYDDLIENPTLINDNNNGKFDDNEYILFSAYSPHAWRLENGYFRHTLNLYDTYNYYYLNINSGINAKQIQDATLPTQAVQYTSNTFDDYAFHEKEEVNLIHSGKFWLGDYFNEQKTSYDFSFDFPNRMPNDSVFVAFNAAARTFVSNFFSLADPQRTTPLATVSIPTTIDNYLADYAYYGFASAFYKPVSTASNVDIRIKYSKLDNYSFGWLDYIQINARRQLAYTPNRQMIFRDKKSIGKTTQYNLTNLNSNTMVWEISNPLKVAKYTLQQANLDLKAKSDSIQTFVAFTPDLAYKPSVLDPKPLKNQNLHSTILADLIIVSHPQFLSQAQELATLRRTENGYTVAVVTPEQIYNEFSSGKQDITAIRDFVRMLYQKNAANPAKQPKFLCLFGDASYDYKYIDKKNPNHNFVPIFESRNSTNPIISYPSDAYFGLMDGTEGEFLEGGSDKMDVAVGRITANSDETADIAIKKLKIYESNKSFGDWRNYIGIIADDQDGNTHTIQGEGLAAIVAQKSPNSIVDKIYLDAYPRISTSGGARYPEVNRAINNRFNAGALAISFIGHGGPVGMADERVLTLEDIDRWKNGNKLPAFVTATCDFTPFDDPARLSAGEKVLLHPNGGSIVLLTTVRTTLADDNDRLVNQTMYNKYFFAKENGKHLTIGEVMRRAMNESLFSTNTRNFTLLGDPSLTLAYPEHTSNITQINSLTVSTISRPDTIKALDKVTIKGIITDQNNNKLTNFNGVVYPTVFDKASNVKTLRNDPRSNIFTFQQFRNIIYKGKASVRNGDFQFSFVVPKDINYSLNYGRLNIYANNETTDAAGHFKNFVVGSSNPNAQCDASGPKIKLYLNDDKFQSNNYYANTSPVLYATIQDTSGINTVGNGIGHDIVAYLDGKPNDIIVLNDFYSASLDDYTSGEIRYQFPKLPVGKHTLTLKVWDVCNNSSEQTIAFNIVGDNEMIINNLTIYPNPNRGEPFTFRFNHNQASQNTQANLQIFALDGRLIKTIKTSFNNPGYVSDEITWDRTTDGGVSISEGMYICRIILTNTKGETASQLAKIMVTQP